jgi:hypothetical protein
MNYKTDDFVRDIKHALHLAKIELRQRKNGQKGRSTIGQLERFVIPDLENLLSKIRSGENFPPNTQQDRYLASFGNAFREWDWDMVNPSPLYLQLLRIHENYRKL